MMLCSGKVMDVTDFERQAGEPTPQVIRVQFENRAEVDQVIMVLQAALRNWNGMKNGLDYGRAIVSLDSYGRKHCLELTFKPKED